MAADKNINEAGGLTSNQNHELNQNHDIIDYSEVKYDTSKPIKLTTNLYGIFNKPIFQFSKPITNISIIKKLFPNFFKKK